MNSPAFNGPVFPKHVVTRISGLLLAGSLPHSGSVFEQVLDAFFDGAPDEKTLVLLAASSAGS
ncbi:MAG: hypothetical protein KF762_07960 [Acidobacteria bacterium]|nr:hypothetical protein [Acidobacteriota bacterium]